MSYSRFGFLLTVLLIGSLIINVWFLLRFRQANWHVQQLQKRMSFERMWFNSHSENILNPNSQESETQ